MFFNEIFKKTKFCPRQICFLCCNSNLTFISECDRFKNLVCNFCNAKLSVDKNYVIYKSFLYLYNNYEITFDVQYLYEYCYFRIFDSVKRNYIFFKEDYSYNIVVNANYMKKYIDNLEFL